MNIPLDKIVCFSFFIIFYFFKVYAIIFSEIIFSMRLIISFGFSVYLFFVCLSIFFKFFFMGFIICFLVSFPFFSHSFLLHMNILTVIIVNKRFGLFSNYIKVYIQFDNSSSAV